MNSSESAKDKIKIDFITNFYIFPNSNFIYRKSNYKVIQTIYQKMLDSPQKTSNKIVVAEAVTKLKSR